MEITIYIIKFFVIPILLQLIIAIILVLLLKRIRFEYVHPIREAVSSKIDIFLINMVLTSPDREELREQLSQFKTEIPLHKSWCKEMIIDEMIGFTSNVQGDTSKQITVLYKALQLDKYSRKLFRRQRACYKCTGFYHFQALNYKKGIPSVKKFLNHSETVTRSNAAITYISLSENYMESFKKFKSNISNLDIIKLMDIIHYKNISIPKNIDRWLDTEYASMTILGLRIMVYYNYIKKSEKIISLIRHKDEKIQLEAVISIRSLFIHEAQLALIDYFDNAKRMVQIEILITLAIIGDYSCITFLKNTIHEQKDKDVKIAAVRCLNTINYEILDSIAANDNDVQQMTRHVREKFIAC